MTMNETNCNQKIDLNFQGYKCYRIGRGPTAISGGVLILGKDHIDSQAVGTKIGKYIIVAAYLPPGKKPEHSELEKIFKCGDKVLVMGDLSAKHKNWNCERANTSGKLLSEYLNKKSYVILTPDHPTLNNYQV